MALLKIEKTNFHFECFEKRRIPCAYTGVIGPVRAMLDPNCGKKAQPHLQLVNCLPPYLGIDQRHLHPSMGCFRADYRLGFAMDLSMAASAREFLRQQLGKKPYKNLRQDRQRLERDHQITFEVYRHTIDPVSCRNLLDKLRGFIRQRFRGREGKHVALNRWTEYEASVYTDILAGRASLFVLSSGAAPIAIALNYHLEPRIFNAAIISFDAAYARYSPGRLMFLYQLEWCYAHKYRLIDTGWGSLEYKIKFANAVYRYQTHALYPKGNILLAILAWGALQLMRLKYYLVMLRDRRLTPPEKAYQGRWLDGESVQQELQTSGTHG
ncbi:GNAT family N-acetyltransferase [Robiginitalea sp. M366]|uniref:GNAT family N-acetyltransferase n=1 Tax=Robiginitalea aestuariiviva TaxID=3036903 RepID=UPI00240DCE47|nr:GNAT family N-acetyltransferase [Robiginitalea aestuariiviva]MDG1572755.1 GNAT family N-acetyltransferase [Robiginitalea aestuariiviva]